MDETIGQRFEKMLKEKLDELLKNAQKDFGGAEIAVDEASIMVAVSIYDKKTGEGDVFKAPFPLFAIRKPFTDQQEFRSMGIKPAPKTAN